MAKRLQCGLFKRSTAAIRLAGSPDCNRAANQARFRRFRFVKNGKRSAKAEFFGIASVNTRDEGADQTIEERGIEFATDEGGDGFVRFGRVARTQQIAEHGEERATGHKGGNQQT